MMISQIKNQEAFIVNPARLFCADDIFTLYKKRWSVHGIQKFHCFLLDTHKPMFAIPVWGAKAVSVDLHGKSAGTDPKVFSDLLHRIRGLLA